LLNDSKLPKIFQGEEDLTFWHAITFNYVQEDYQINSRFTRYLSNNFLSYTLGFEYSVFRFGLAFPLNTSFMNKKYPVSSNFEISCSFPIKNVFFNVKYAQTQGFYNVSGLSEFAENEDFNTRYRGDMGRLYARLSGYYYLDKNFRYNKAMNVVNKFDKSGYTFWAGGKFIYHQFMSDSTLFLSNYLDNDENNFYRKNHIGFTAMLGFSGILAYKHWFLVGQVGIGAQMQAQLSSYSDTKTRFKVQPDLDILISGGYKIGAFSIAIDFPMETFFNFMRQKDLLIENNLAICLRMGFTLNNLLK
jgi:hypothetical protein